MKIAHQGAYRGYLILGEVMIEHIERYFWETKTELLWFYFGLEAWLGRGLLVSWKTSSR